MIGEVQRWDKHKQVGAILTSDHQTVLAFPQDIAYDSAGRQFLISGEMVEFDVVASLPSPRALDVTLVEPRVIPDYYREDSEVISWNATRKTGWGFARRPVCGGVIYVHSSKFITEGKLAVGSVFRCKPSPPIASRFKTAEATEIEIYMDANV
jgi:cold shock CspA family protein